MSIIKRIATILLTLVLTLTFIPLVPNLAVYASDGFDQDEYVIDAGYPRSELYMHCNTKIAPHKVGVSDATVVQPMTVYDDGVSILPIGVGETNVYFFDGIRPGTSMNCFTTKVIVTEAGLASAMKNLHEIEWDDLGYGSKKVRISGAKGTKYTIKSGSTKIASGTFESYAEKTVKLPKVYKVGTTLTYSVSYPYTSGGTSKTLTFTNKFKINKQSYVSEARLKSKKKIKISLENVHKGDVFKLTYKGKTYTKKIKKNYPKDSGDYTFTIKLKKKMTKNSKFKVKITNKYKQTLLKSTIKLHNGSFWIYGDD